MCPTLHNFESVGVWMHGCLGCCVGVWVCVCGCVGVWGLCEGLGLGGRVSGCVGVWVSGVLCECRFV